MVAFSLRFGIKEWDDAVAAIATQDDRSTAIVTSSLLEDFILKAIKFRFMQSDAKIEREFMKGYGPLSSFRSRIDLGFFMGFYAKDCHARLLRVKDIRNKMAHNIEVLTFETQIIKDLLQHIPDAEELALCWEETFKNSNDHKMQEFIQELRDYPQNGKGKFLCYIQHRIASMLAFHATRGPTIELRFRVHHP